MMILTVETNDGMMLFDGPVNMMWTSGLLTIQSVDAPHPHIQVFLEEEQAQEVLASYYMHRLDNRSRLHLNLKEES